MGWLCCDCVVSKFGVSGVGFSYCDYPNCTNSDSSTAIDNHNVLKQFFAGFPEFQKNDFYITGESYAGVYVAVLWLSCGCSVARQGCGWAMPVTMLDCDLLAHVPWMSCRWAVLWLRCRCAVTVTVPWLCCDCDCAVATL